MTYPASQIKRTRSTKAEVEARREALLDAIEPNQLRDLVRSTIEQHLPAEQYEILKTAEESERELLTNFVAAINGGAS